MKILWVKSDFLHPTTTGGQIRTLELVRWLHQRHEVHYAGLYDGNPEGPDRAKEYSTRSYAIPHHAPDKASLGFAAQLAAGLVSPVPVAVERWRSKAMRSCLTQLLTTQKFDSLVCDFLFPVPNIPDLSKAVLFQHNVESMIWRRRASLAPDPVTRFYLNLQARRMVAFEAAACRRAGQVIAVSEGDGNLIRDEFGVERIATIPTGVNLQYFEPPTEPVQPAADLVFVGSMDWMPNVDGIHFFVREVLPRIHARLPHVKVAVVGRKPPADVEALAHKDKRLIVTGTVPDVRPYLWGSRVSIVPLRIGGGTRLKIYEAIAAGLPVVSTTIGAEGLPLRPQDHIMLADTAEDFAASCCQLLETPQARTGMAARALQFVSERFSSDEVAQIFERILAAGPRPGSL